MNYEQLEFDIVRWLKDYYYMHALDSFVVGVSGGIDSAVTSTLCAKTELPVHAVGMPGNKVEDYGVGFYTKYGDGGVDIAPIADLYKTQVWGLGEYMGVPQEIIDAEPTDGLWDDKRTDESQLGVSYEQLEWVMESGIVNNLHDANEVEMWKGVPLTEDQRTAVKQYTKFNTMNKHKMLPIPTFKLEKDYELS
jgi:NAD+ synthase